MTRVHLLVLLGAAILLPGCESDLVQSTPVTAVPKGGADPTAYARYALQQTVLTIDIDDGSAGGGGGAGSGSGTASATTPSTMINNTYNASPAGAAAAPAGGAAAPAGGGNGPPEKAKDKAAEPVPTLAATCSDLRKAYDNGRMQFIAFRVAQAVAAGQVRGWAGAPATADETKIKTLLDGYKATRTTGIGGFQSAVTDIPTINKYCPPNYKITLSQKDEADRAPAKSYVVRINPNDFFDEQFNVQTGGDGTLVSVGYTSTDRTTDTLVNLAKSIVTLSVSSIGLPPGPGAAQVDNRCTLGQNPDDWASKIPKPVDAAYLGNLATCIGADRVDLADLDDIDVGHFERTVVVEEGDKMIALPHGLTLTLACQAKATTLPASSGGPSDPQGIFVSSPEPCQAIISQPTHPNPNDDHGQYARDMGISEGQQILSRTAFVAMDSNAPLILPVKRTLFVSRTATYTFASGRLTTATYNRPSPAVNASLLPATLVGAVVGTITGQITSRTSNLGAKTQYVNAQTDNANAQVKLKQAQAAAAAAQAAQSGSNAASAP
jgi:hypothetical protein